MYLSWTIDGIMYLNRLRPEYSRGSCALCTSESEVNKDEMISKFINGVPFSPVLITTIISCFCSAFLNFLVFGAFHYMEILLVLENPIWINTSWVQVRHKLIVCSVAQSCPTLCDPMDYSPPGPLSKELSRQEYWRGVLFSPPGYLPDPGIKSVSPVVAGGFFTISAMQ